MPKSHVDTRFDVEETVWVVSALQSGDKLGGHSFLVVEGIQQDHHLGSILFVGQYDIRATPFENQNSSLNFNPKGAITSIKCHEGTTYTREYNKYPSKSHYASPEKVREMIASIKADAEICEKASRGECEYPLYQYVGTNHFLSDIGMGDNCASWTIKKLAIAGIGDGTAKSKPKVPAGRLDNCVIS